MQKHEGEALHGCTTTAQLYFAWSMQSDIEHGKIRQISPTMFQHGRTLLVFRHCPLPKRLPKHDRLIFVLDDDWRAGIRDRHLPLTYRATLAAREGLSACTLERKAELILLSSEVLLERYRARYGAKRLRILEPAWPLSTAPTAGARPTRLALMSAATHKNDFQFLLPVIERLIENEGVELTVSLNAGIPRTWHSRPNVTTVPVLNWRGYRAWMAGKNFDILLYPMCDSPFNAARSRNKILESDQLGAALVASSSWKPGKEAAREGRCMALPQDRDIWFEAVSNLIRTKNAANLLASANRSVIASEDPLDRQRRQWTGILSGDSRPTPE